MKKTKLVALTLVVAMMMMGAGYAYWSEVLEIENTVETGELDVVFDEFLAVSGESPYQNPIASSEAHIKPGTDKHAVEVSFIDVYPGLENTLEFTLNNEGTIGAYVRDFAYTPVGTDYTSQIIVKKLKIEGHTDMTTPTTLQGAMDYLNSLKNNKGIFVEADLVTGGTADDTIEIDMVIQIDPNATEATLPELGSFGFNITSNVHQYNE